MNPHGLIGWLIMGIMVIAMNLAHAVDIQFDLSPPNSVTGVSDLPMDPTVPNRGIITLIGSAADIVWPVPIGSPTNTSCGVGQSSWTRIADAGGVTLAGAGMALLNGQVFFQSTSTLLTGCHRVSSKRQTRAIREQAILAGVNTLDPLILALSGVHTWKQELCPPTNNSANCVTWRAQADIVDASYPSRVQGATFETDMATLITESNTLIDAQCKATPGGPFC